MPVADNKTAAGRAKTEGGTESKKTTRTVNQHNKQAAVYCPFILKKIKMILLIIIDTASLNHSKIWQ